MNLQDLLTPHIEDPVQRLAIAQVEQHSDLLDELICIRKRRMTQGDLADLMGISQGAVARIEAGDRDPRLSTLGRYAHALGVLITYRVRRREDGGHLSVHLKSEIAPYQFGSPKNVSINTFGRREMADAPA
ncbi:helix-turn-helix domain-containing protein [Serinicoccus hydrothermalis]|uniref:helix-turn-helix domain-containing protein n=1 Tax=Serinicoccus hydrothermalis TaxID=1758689 RepID=UPI000831E934|nr:helix-turn-helix transcriptional regulator [Serinicoccus hydrothermalis]